MVPELVSLYAPGRIYRLNIAKAHNLPLGVTFVPSVSTR